MCVGGNLHFLPLVRRKILDIAKSLLLLSPPLPQKTTFQVKGLLQARRGWIQKELGIRFTKPERA
jgi:hypothetical protein